MSNPANSAGLQRSGYRFSFLGKHLRHRHDTFTYHDCVRVSYLTRAYNNDTSKNNPTQSWSPQVFPNAMIVSKDFYKYLYSISISQSHDCHDCVKIILVSKLIVGLTQSWHNHRIMAVMIVSQSLHSKQLRPHNHRIMAFKTLGGIPWLCQNHAMIVWEFLIR